MERTLSPARSTLEQLLQVTRKVKKVIKGAHKIHSKLEKDYVKLINSCEIQACPDLSKLIGTHTSYIKSYLNYNQEVIRSTRISRDCLKRLVLDIKSKISIVKVEKKSLSRLKGENPDRQIEDILSRCQLLVSNCTNHVKTDLSCAVDTHLSSLKFLTSGNENMQKSVKKHESRMLQAIEEEDSHKKCMDFSRELDESLLEKTRSKVKKLGFPHGKINEDLNESSLNSGIICVNSWRNIEECH